MNIGEDVEKLKPSYTTGGNVKWHSCFGKQSGDSSKKSNIELLYVCVSHWGPTLCDPSHNFIAGNSDPAIPFLDRYKRNKNYVQIKTSMKYS